MIWKISYCIVLAHFTYYVHTVMNTCFIIVNEKSTERETQKVIFSSG